MADRFAGPKKGGRDTKRSDRINGVAVRRGCTVIFSYICEHYLLAYRNHGRQMVKHLYAENHA